MLDPHRLRRYRRLPLLSSRMWVRRVTIYFGALLVALAAIAFAFAADRAAGLFISLHLTVPWLSLLIPPFGLGLSVWLTRRFFPGAQGSGIPQVIAALHLADPHQVRAVLSPRIAVGKVVLTLLGLASGASIGREGPTVQVGASIMNGLAGLLRLPRMEVQRAMVLAGGAAGVAAAFNTPLAGIVFAIEELSHSFESRTSGTVLTAVVIGGITTLALAGNYTYFGVTSAQLGFGPGWLAVIVCALCGGTLGGAFSRVLLAAAKGLPGRGGRLVMTYPIAFAVLCGLALSLIGLASGGTTYGTGYAQARMLVEGHSALPAGFFVWKFAATVVSYLSGIPGGIFAPSLAVGAGLGDLLAPLMPFAPPAAVILLGMVGYFSGAVQAPITATVIVMEMTDNQSLTVPLMATAMLAYGTSRLVCRRPLYGTLARRILAANSVARSTREPIKNVGVPTIMNNDQEGPTMDLKLNPPDASVPSNTVKDPDNWTTGGETMTGAQSSYLKTLCEEAGESFDSALSKAEASKRIDELQARTGRGRNH